MGIGFNRFALYIVFLLLTALPCAARGGRPNAFPKGTIYGKLENGLSYIIKPNAQPAHTTEFRLVMKVGSVQEEDWQCGTAHFLEHMAFAGSERYPGFTMVDSLEALGMKFGRDMNAMTGMDRTVYLFTVPMEDGDNRLVAKMLGMLDDILCSLTFAEPIVETERSIILEELRQYTPGDEFYDLKIGSGRWSRRIPLGSSDDIRRVTRQDLQDFYNRWYVPEQAGIIVVGNVDPKATERLIRSTFSKIKPGRVRKEAYSFDHDEGLTMETHDDDATSGVRMTLFLPNRTIVEKDPHDSYEKRLKAVLVSLLNQRSTALDLNADFSNSWYLADKDFFSISLRDSTSEALLGRVTRVASALKSVCDRGFGAQEQADAIASSLRRMPGPAQEKDSGLWCDDFTDYFISGDRYLCSERDVRRVQRLMKRTDTSVLGKLLASMLNEGLQSALAAVKKNPSRQGPEAQEIQAAWNEGWAQVAPEYVYEHRPASTDSMVETPVPARLRENIPYTDAIVANRQQYPRTRTTDLRLANGLRLILRPTSDGTDNFYFEAFGRGGTADIPADDFHRLEGTAGYLSLGGIDGVDADSLSAFVLDRGISYNAYLADWWHGFMCMAPASEAASAFQFAIGKCLHPEIPEAEFEEYRADELQNLELPDKLMGMVRMDPYRAARAQLDLLSGDAQSLCIRDARREDIMAMSRQEMTSYWRGLFSDPSRMTVVISGNFELEDMIRTAACTFGSIPTSGKETTSSDCFRFSLPTASFRRSFSGGSAGEAYFTLSCFGNYTPSLRSSLMLKLMRDAVQQRLLNVLRRDEGLSYSPFTDVSYHGCDGERFHLDVTATVAPENCERCEKLVEDILEGLARTPVDTMELENMKKSFLANKAMVLSEDASAIWRSEIVNRIKNGESLEDFENYETVLGGITPEDLRKGFRSLLPARSYLWVMP